MVSFDFDRRADDGAGPTKRQLDAATRSGPDLGHVTFCFAAPASTAASKVSFARVQVFLGRRVAGTAEHLSACEQVDVAVDQGRRRVSGEQALQNRCSGASYAGSSPSGFTREGALGSFQIGWCNRII